MFLVLSDRMFCQVFKTEPTLVHGQWSKALRIHTFEPEYVERLKLDFYLIHECPREVILTKNDNGQTIRVVRLANDEIIIFNRFQPVIGFCGIAPEMMGLDKIEVGVPHWLVFQ